METDDGDFVLMASTGEERFLFTTSAETLFIKVSGNSPSFVFMADAIEAEAMMRWLITRLSK